MKNLINSVVRIVRKDFLAGRIVRCRKCRRFHAVSAIAVYECSVCMYHTGRCFKCGGDDGAILSVKGHVRVFASKAFQKKFGIHHHDAVVAEVSSPARKFKVLSGGRR